MTPCEDAKAGGCSGDVLWSHANSAHLCAAHQFAQFVASTERSEELLREWDRQQLERAIASGAQGKLWE